MTSLCRNPTVLLLFLTASPLLHSHLFTNAASTSPPITRPQIKYVTGLGFEYDSEYDDPDNVEPEIRSTKKTSILHGDAQICQYNRCLEDQVPCATLSEETGCLCPGYSGMDKPPHAPRIQALLPISQGDNRGKIEVQWCAPSSMVSSYRVVIEGREEDALEFGNTLRRGLVDSLEVGTKVCVEAVNNAGHSAPSDFSCKRYDYPETSDHQVMTGVIVGGIVFLLLLIITAVIIWKHQKNKKAKRDSADGLGNPSYTTEGSR